MNGIPLHPMMVHLPVILIPLTVLMALPALFSRRWFQWSAPLTLAFSLAAAVGSALTTATGEQLAEADGESSALLQRHEQLDVPGSRLSHEPELRLAWSRAGPAL